MLRDEFFETQIFLNNHNSSCVRSSIQIDFEGPNFEILFSVFRGRILMKSFFRERKNLLWRINLKLHVLLISKFFIIHVECDLIKFDVWKSTISTISGGGTIYDITQIGDFHNDFDERQGQICELQKLQTPFVSKFDYHEFIY